MGLRAFTAKSTYSIIARQQNPTKLPGCVRRRVAELEGVIESLRESNTRLEAEVADLTRSSATGTPPGCLNHSVSPNPDWILCISW